MILRGYQREAIDAVFDEFGRVNSTLLVAPVGAGKTVMQAAFIKKSISMAPRCRFVCAVHTRELIQQNANAMLAVLPEAPIGINSASLRQRSTLSQILFCSIQSVYLKASQIGWADCLIVDECHLISRKGTTMYQRLIRDLRRINPDMCVLGMSGTPYRMDSGLLTEGPDALFRSTAFEIGIRRLIDEEWLTRPISKATATRFDIGGVHIRGGDYVAGELERAVNIDSVTKSAVTEIIKFGQDRRAWLVFCAGVAHAKAVRDVFRTAGVPCETVEGNTPGDERGSIIRRFKSGELRCLTNVNVLSTGFDHPGIDLIALMRPTKSVSLYVQQCGRGLRLAPNKSDVLILDFANIIRTLGPLDMVNPMPRGGDGKGEAPTKVCPDCKEIVHISCLECPDCGHEFPSRAQKPKHDARAESNLGILSTERTPPVMVPVVAWRFARHIKPGSHDSVRVTYVAGLAQFNEWLAFEHHGYAKTRAEHWWNQHSGVTPPPWTVAEALARAGELVMPATISVRQNGRFFDIVARSFGERGDVVTPRKGRAA